MEGGYSLIKDSLSCPRVSDTQILEMDFCSGSQDMSKNQSRKT